jgi:hypothetical protein
VAERTIPEKVFRDRDAKRVGWAWLVTVMRLQQACGLASTLSSGATTGGGRAALPALFSPAADDFCIVLVVSKRDHPKLK